MHIHKMQQVQLGLLGQQASQTSWWQCRTSTHQELQKCCQSAAGCAQGHLHKRVMQAQHVLLKCDNIALPDPGLSGAAWRP